MTAAICRRLFGCVRSRLDAVGVYGIYSCSITKIFNIFLKTLRKGFPAHRDNKKMKIAIASDHGGYALKNELLPYITELGHEFRDFGCCSTDSMDYPDIAFPAAEAVASGEFDRGILICGTGMGIHIAASKCPHVHAGVVESVPAALRAITRSMRARFSASRVSAFSLSSASASSALEREG